MEVRENVSIMEDEVPFGVDVETVEIVPAMDDMEADNCVRKIGNWERFREFWLNYYAKKIEEVNQKCDRNIAYQNRKLRDFFASVPHRASKTMEAYDLPSGRISVTYSKQKLVPNKDSILARLKADGEVQFIKTKEELDWSSYSSRLFISDNGDVMDKETGEIVEDVAIEASEPKFTVKTTKKGSEEE